MSSRPQWLTVKGGAKNYVEAVARAVPAHQVHMCMPVTSVRGSGSVGEDGCEKVLVSAKRGSVEFEYEYDHVIVATHGDQALRLLGEGATETEREILGEFRTSRNTAVLHGDKKVCALFCCRIIKKKIIHSHNSCTPLEGEERKKE